MRSSPALLLALAVLVGSPAWAGDDPWTLEKGDLSFYAGASETTWSSFSGSESSWASDPVSIQSRVFTTLAGATVEYGVSSRGSVELRGAGGWAQVADTAAPTCSAMGAGSCDTTFSGQAVDLRFKVRILDEIGLSPVTLSGSPVVRIGALGRDSRGRFTAIGDGRSDVGVQLSAGRMGLVGPVLVAGHVAGRYSHRFSGEPEADAALPRHELAGVGELDVSLRRGLTLGLCVDALHRPDGQEWDDVDPSQEDRFAALSITDVKGGLKAGVQVRQGLRVWGSGMRTVYARNNPADTLSLGFGVSWYQSGVRQARGG